LRKLLMLVFPMILCVACLLVGARAETERSVLLDNAFRFLEENNSFTERYNRLTGAQVEPLFPTGMPYFFGGKDFKDVMARYPRFRKKNCLEQTSYYRRGQSYVYGLDCHGFINAVRTESGYSEIPALSILYNPIHKDKSTGQRYNWKQYYVWWQYAAGSPNPDNPLPEPDEIRDDAVIGDLMLVHSKGNHILMYIGTLRDFGYTEEEVPALEDYLDYPLMIHCGPSPVYGERIQTQVIDAEPDYFKRTNTTNGGVQVSIWGVPREAAESHVTVQGTDFDFFLLPNGQVLTIYDMRNVSKWRWLRLPEKVPVPKH